MASLTSPMTSGGKKPPRPPAAPTMPVTAPFVSGKKVGTILNTAPAPMPRKNASVRQKIVTGTMVGSDACQERPTASSPTPKNAMLSTRCPPKRSAQRPPSGLAISAATIVKPAVRAPALVCE
jgi:hypothetical protein